MGLSESTPKKNHQFYVKHHEEKEHNQGLEHQQGHYQQCQQEGGCLGVQQ